MPQMQFSTDVLPAPLGPMRASSSPLFARSDTSRSTERPPKARETRSSSSSAIPAAATPVLLDLAVAATLAGRGAEIELADVLMRAQPLGRAVEHDASVFHHVAVIGDVERHLRVLLDDEKRHAKAITDLAQAVHQFLHRERGEAERQFVHQQK